jgi:phenylacetate-CoA ligase
MATTADWALGLPRSQNEIDRIHRERKRVAIERARASPLMRSRVSGLDLNKLDDPEEWAKIPPLSKEELRKLATEEFYRDFCIAPISAAVQLWRSGGSTGKPLFYPRSAEDMRYMLGVAFRRTWACVGATAADTFHDSYPLGIHPVAQLFARSAEMDGIGTVWAGAGTTTPSALQLELIRDLKPTIFGAMPSYALHLANVAERQGFDLASSSVKKLVVSAEPLTAAKREKLARVWGAEVYNTFGMTEGAMITVERAGNPHGGAMLAWSDLFYLEVIDPATGRLKPEGEFGALVMTPIWSNTITPFLRWLTGDIVAIRRQERSDDPFSVFPLLEHGLRTEGFFKVRGVNINHGDFEDFMFQQKAVADFRCEAVATGGLDELRVLIEIARGAEAGAVAAALGQAIKAKFEISPRIEVQPLGTIAADFEKSVKAPRFADRR